MKFDTTLPTDPAYAEFAAMLDAARKPKITGFDYQGVIDHYNTLPVGAIFSFPFPKTKGKYLIGRLKVAGLIEPKDYELLLENEEQEDGSGVMTAYFTKRSKIEGGKLPIAGQHRPKVTATEQQQSEPEPEPESESESESESAPPPRSVKGDTPTPPPPRSVKGGTPTPPPPRSVKGGTPTPPSKKPPAVAKPQRRSPPKA